MRIQYTNGQLDFLSSNGLQVSYAPLKGWVNDSTNLWYSEHSNLLLLKVPSVLFVDENKVEVVSDAELFVDISESRCQVEATKEEPYGNGFS